MERLRKLNVAILVILTLIALIAIIDVSLKIEDKKRNDVKISLPETGPGIAVVNIEGVIQTSARTTFGMADGAQLVISRLDELSGNSNIRAVVIRINSPGGSVAATQEIYEKLWKLRKKNIILVASMADVAASGGYYVASACNHIIANYGTVTGSIGVIALSPNLQRLFDKFGIRMNVIKSGKYKDILSSHRDMTEDERKMLQEMIDSSYNKFVHDVALGRNMNQDDIRIIADGRVMNGETALRHKLIDQLGTYEDALAKAKELASLPADAPVYDESTSPIQEIFGSLRSMFSGRMKNAADALYSPEILEYRYMQ